MAWEPNSLTHSARLGSSAFRSDTRNISRRSWPNSVENYQHSRTYRQAGYCCCTARRPASTMPYGASAQTSHEPLQQLMTQQSAHAWHSYSDYQRMTCRQHPATRITQLALKQGGLGLWGTQNHTAAAYWASWQDAAPILRSKAPQDFGLLSQQLCTGNPGLPTIQCLQHVTAFLSNLGFQAPPCTQCAEPPQQSPAEPADHTRGWQRTASTTTDQT